MKVKVKNSVQLFSFFVLLIQVERTLTSLLKNGVIGEPRVECGVDSIAVFIRTENDFHGRLYVEEELENNGCVHNYAENSEYSQTAEFSIRFGQCNMRRQRILNPRGVTYSFTLVISFHPVFLTGVDKAFHIKCLYLEAVKTVDIALNISFNYDNFSPLTTTVIEREFALPQCTYHLKQGPDGPFLKYANIGEPITHVWHCDPVASWLYGILIHSCYVDDGRGNHFDLIDEKGCAIDRYLLDDLVYQEKGLGAFVNAHVFRYADRVQLFFTCTLQLCFREDGGCDGITPPVCNNRKDTRFSSTSRHEKKELFPPPSQQPPSLSPSPAAPPDIPIPPGLSAPRELLRKLQNRALRPILNHLTSNQTTLNTSEEPLLGPYKDLPLTNDSDILFRNNSVRASRDATIGKMETDLSADLTVLPLHDTTNLSEELTRSDATDASEKSVHNNNITLGNVASLQLQPGNVSEASSRPNLRVFNKKQQQQLIEPKTSSLNTTLSTEVVNNAECSQQIGGSIPVLLTIFLATIILTSTLTSLICIKKQKSIAMFCCYPQIFKRTHTNYNYRY